MQIHCIAYNAETDVSKIIPTHSSDILKWDSMKQK